MSSLIIGFDRFILLRSFSLRSTSIQKITFLLSELSFGRRRFYHCVCICICFSNVVTFVKMCTRRNTVRDKDEQNRSRRRKSAKNESKSPRATLRFIMCVYFVVDSFFTLLLYQFYLPAFCHSILGSGNMNCTKGLYSTLNIKPLDKEHSQQKIEYTFFFVSCGVEYNSLVSLWMILLW